MAKRKMTEAQKAALAKGRASLGLKKKGESKIPKDKKVSKGEVVEKTKETPKDEEEKEDLKECAAFKIFAENAEVYRNFFKSKTAYAIKLNESEIKELSISYDEFCQRFSNIFMSFASGNANPSLNYVTELYETGILVFTTMFSNKQFPLALSVLTQMTGLSGMMCMLNSEEGIPAANSFISYLEKALDLVDEDNYIFSERINLLINELEECAGGESSCCSDDEDCDEDDCDEDSDEEDYYEAESSNIINERAMLDPKDKALVDALGDAMEKYKDPKHPEVLKAKAKVEEAKKRKAEADAKNEE